MLRRSLATMFLWWEQHKTRMLQFTILLMAIAAPVWLSYEGIRLLWQPTAIGSYQVHPGAIDLKMRYQEVVDWFAGRPVYEESANAVYPPVSYALLWPLLGWLEEQWAIRLWALTSVIMLGWLVAVIVRESHAETGLERVMIGLLPLSMYATGATIGNGQMLLHLQPVLVTGILFLQRTRAAWIRDLLAAALITISLIKPSVSVPFCWLVVILPRRLRPTFFVMFFYALLWWWTSFFQQATPFTLLKQWIHNGEALTERAMTGQWSLHRLMILTGAAEWGFLVLLLLLILLGVWVFWHRDCDLWILLGVTAIFARMWTYHRWYDDLLLLLPMLALFRMSKHHALPRMFKRIAGSFFVVMLCLMIAPGGQYLLPHPLKNIYLILQLLVWLGVLIFLVYSAHATRQGSMRSV